MMDMVAWINNILILTLKNEVLYNKSMNGVSKNLDKKSFTYQSDDDGEKECFYDIDLEHYCHDQIIQMA
jgi:hypothetical protein